MSPHNFNPYKEVIESSIKSCLNTNQLNCCWDMIERFKEVFMPHKTPKEISLAANELYELYSYKSRQLLIL